MDAYPTELFERQYRRFSAARATEQGTNLMSCSLPEHNTAMAIFMIPNWGMDSHCLEMVWHLNNWGLRQTEARVWLKLLDEDEEGDRWLTQLQFVDPLLHYCLMQPSTHKDRLVRVVAVLLHQANLILDNGFNDRLEEDDLPKGRHLSSAQRIQQLTRLGARWYSSKPLIEQIKAINSKSYREATGHYRNEASHFIPPRLGVGYTRRIEREVFCVSDMSGFERELVFPGQPLTAKKVRYVMKEREPLNIGSVLESCEQEFNKVAAVLCALDPLMREVEKACQLALPHIGSLNPNGKISPQGHCAE